jgi:hypothetical protein
MKNRFAFGVVLLTALSLNGAARPPKVEPGGWCCLCMCHAVDENKCAQVCIKMQHGTRVIEEPEMVACTKSCQRIGVKRVRYQ